MEDLKCPKCQSFHIVKSGIISGRQRHKCKNCNFYFTVDKIGKRIDPYYVTKSLQLYIEGLSYREIERLLGVSHVSVANWVKQYGLSRPINLQYHPSYKILTHQQLLSHFEDKATLKGAGSIITEVGDKYMLIQWDRFKQ